MSAMRLPELEERSSVGGRLVQRTVSITLVGLLLLAVLGALALTRVTMDLTVEAMGVLEPLKVWRVHSTVAGVVREVRVQPREEVEAGQLLLRLDDFQVVSELERLRLEAEHQRGQTGAAKLEAERLEQSIRGLEKRLARFGVTAPAAGRILSEDLEELSGRHVDEGQRLLDVGSPSEWKAMLRVAEREIGQIRIGDPVKLKIPALTRLGTSNSEPLPAAVHFMGSELLEESTDGRGLYRVDVKLEGESLDPQQLDQLRRGMTVEARIVTRSARAIDLVSDYFKRQLGAEG